MSNLYETDEPFWRERQIQLLQEGRESEVDYTALLQMLLEMSGSEERTVKGLSRILIMHLLKLKYQPNKMTRSWFSSVRSHRRDLLDVIKSRSKTLYNYFVEKLPDIYESARDMAIDETGLSESDIPKECPFSVEEILNPSFYAGRSHMGF